jgi:hypothetical protein
MDDRLLSELLRNEPNPIEKLANEQLQLQAIGSWFTDVPKWTAHFMKTGQRIVALECGHYVLSKSLRRAACSRCGEMIRSGYDYDGFRRLGIADNFHWPDDPLFALNEGERSGSGKAATRFCPV